MVFKWVKLEIGGQYTYFFYKPLVSLLILIKIGILSLYFPPLQDHRRSVISYGGFHPPLFTFIPFGNASLIITIQAQDQSLDPTGLYNLTAYSCNQRKQS